MWLRQTRLLVNNFDACFRFYRDVLGFLVIWGEAGGGYASFSNPNDNAPILALYKRDLMAEVIHTTDLPADAVCQDRVLLAIEVTDVDQFAATLVERGIELITEPHNQPDWGIRCAFLRDPDGNLIEINMGLTSDEWSDELRAENEKYGSAV
ncbi:MAG: VOC family protein [Anaerolineales bacterium]|nr:VOC family protein [Anaerolineales bacterium]